MSATTLEPVAAPAPPSDDELDHLYCCDPDVGLCGTDLTDVPEILEPLDLGGPFTCRACVRLIDAPCGPDCRAEELT